ncbi:hypothetical protein MTO96_023449 [Rhipicephalus appendiculatus]
MAAMFVSVCVVWCTRATAICRVKKNSTRTLITEVPKCSQEVGRKKKRKKIISAVSTIVQRCCCEAFLDFFFFFFWCSPLKMRGCTLFATAARYFCTSGPYLLLRSRKFCAGHEALRVTCKEGATFVACTRFGRVASMIHCWDSVIF